MNDIKVMVGERYLVTKQFTLNQRTIQKDTVLYAWFCGQLTMLEVTPGGVLDHNKAYITTPGRIIEKIRAGKLEMIDRFQFEAGEFYTIDYGKFKKTACYLGNEDDKHFFFDDNGKFAFTVEYLVKGPLKFEKVESE